MTAPHPQFLLDTSVAVALLIADHPAHGLVRDQLGSSRLGIAGHALFETYSVLTRLPPPHRRSPVNVHRLLDANFPYTRHLDPEMVPDLLAEFAAAGIAGGATYDALVAAAARFHQVPLATRDDRAFRTYSSLGVDVRRIEHA